MKIGVVSDTHVPLTAEELPQELIDGLAGVDLILHAGDMVNMSVFNELSLIAPVKAVTGNMDDCDIRTSFPVKQIICVEDIKIGLIHGYGHAKNIITTVQAEFDSSVDMIVFGHSHMPCCQQIKNILFFNPGSPTDKLFAPYNSFGIIEVKGNKIDPKIVRI